VLVVLFTLLSAAAQYLIKTGANRIGPHPAVMELITNIPLLAGLVLYGLGAMLMVLALRHGELSALYPVFALTFVWVTILSVTVFHETLNFAKLAGIILIVGGVATLGRGSKK